MGLPQSFEYAPHGNVLTSKATNGLITRFSYDILDNLLCDWVVSQYDYTYDDRGFITGEDAIESLYGYAWDDKHDGKHENWHDTLYPNGDKHYNKHDKDGLYGFQIIETKREFEYDDNGKLLSATENEDRQGRYDYTFQYDDMGNRTFYSKSRNGKVQESVEYTYNSANQPIKAKEYDGKHYKTVEYSYDLDGNRIMEEEIKPDGTRKVEKVYEYTVENRLKAVSDKEDLLTAMAYDGDGNRIFQLNYNLHTDDDWKGNTGNGNGSSKDNSGSGNNGNTSGNGTGSKKSTGLLGFLGGLFGEEEAEAETTKAAAEETTAAKTKGNGKDKEKEKDKDKGNGNSGNNGNADGNTNNTGGSQNQSGILFPIDGEVSELEQELIGLIKTTGKQKDYELVEYVNDVNREHAEVLMELSMIWQSYQYEASGTMSFGQPQYNNVYGYNAESYNPNVDTQYLRSRYYSAGTANFLTEDSYLGDIADPLSLNRYNYVNSSPLNYADPSGHEKMDENNLEDIRDSFSEIMNRGFGFSEKHSDMMFAMYYSLYQNTEGKDTDLKFAQLMASMTYHSPIWNTIAGTYGKPKTMKEKMIELVNQNKALVRCFSDTENVNVKAEVENLINEMTNQQRVSQYADFDSYKEDFKNNKKMDKEKIERLQEVYATYKNKPDFVHMMATMAASMKSGDTIGGNLAGAIGAGLPLKDAAGYGGDVYGVFAAKPSMNHGDYLSDLDGVNLFELRGEDTNLLEVMSPYYDSLFTMEINRADEFAINIGNGNREEGIKYLETQLNNIKITDKHFVRIRDYKIAESFISHIKNSRVQW